MKLFDQYVEAVKAAFPNPSPAMARYIDWPRYHWPKAAEAVDIDVELADRRSRWEALT
jgi:hypothetical protein